MGVATGCVCKEVSILLIPTTLVSVLFCSSILLFVHLKKCFSFLLEEERRRMPNRDFLLRVVRILKLHYYSDIIHSFDWKSALEHDGGV